MMVPILTLGYLQMLKSIARLRRILYRGSSALMLIGTEGILNWNLNLLFSDVNNTLRIRLSFRVCRVIHYLCRMRSIINRIDYLLLALCVTLVVVDFNTFEGLLSHHPIHSPVECSDTSGQAEQSHSDCTGDEIFAKSPKAKPGLFPNLIGVLPDLSDPLTGNYSSSIWQPPRIL